MQDKERPDYTVNLKACDDANTLYYRVSVLDSNNVEAAGFVHETENYNEALIYAKIYFDELTQNQNVVVASYIEQPGRLTGQGALYSIGSFVRPEEIVSDEQFYNALAEEFNEHCLRENNADVNVIFRQIVAKHKLDLYKESKFLQHLQRLHIIDPIEED